MAGLAGGSVVGDGEQDHWDVVGAVFVDEPLEALDVDVAVEWVA